MRKFSSLGLSLVVIFSAVVLCMDSTAQTPSPAAMTKLHGIRLSGSPFPLLKLAECNRQGSIYESADFTVNVQGSGLTIQGQDPSGKSWEAKARFNGLGCQIFQGDLSGDGRQDLIIWLPGIGSTGVYDTHLIVLLFNSTGKPFPWSATGQFTLATHGIEEISRSASGGAVILHSYIVGSRVWGGVTYVSTLYKVVNDEISQIKGNLDGIEFPRATGAKAANTSFLHLIQTTGLSTIAPGNNATASAGQASFPRFVRYGAESSKIATAYNNAVLSPEEGVDLRIDTNALNAQTNHIVLSDGSQLDLPNILIVNLASGGRKIIFGPDDKDFAQLTKGSYAIQQIGSDCLGVDDCHPFILKAMEQSPE